MHLACLAKQLWHAPNRLLPQVTRLAVCGNFQTPSWDLGAAHDLKYTEASGGCWRVE